MPTLSRSDEDRKIRFAERVKEHQARLGRNDVRLDSFLFSETPYQASSWWGYSQDELEAKHLRFRDDQPQRVVRKMFDGACGRMSRLGGGARSL